MLNQRHLDYLFAVEKAGSFTRAAEQLNLSQPSLSRLISDMEEKLGFRIFNRSSNPIVPTKEGLIYLNACRNAKKIEQNALNEIQSMLCGDVGSITVAFNSPCNRRITPELAVRFHSEFPNVKLSVIQHSLHMMEDLVQSGIADLAIVNTTDNQSLMHRYITTERVYILVPPYFAKRHNLKPGFNRVEIDPSEIAQEPFILLRENHGMRRIADRIFSDLKIEPNVVIETDEYYNSKTLTEGDIGFSFTTSFELQSETMFMCKVQNYESPRDLYICYQKNRTHSVAFDRLCTLIEEIANEVNNQF